MLASQIANVCRVILLGHCHCSPGSCPIDLELLALDVPASNHFSGSMTLTPFQKNGHLLVVGCGLTHSREHFSKFR